MFGLSSKICYTISNDQRRRGPHVQQGIQIQGLPDG